MLQTIQVEIDSTGHIRPIESLSLKPVGRALLTLLDNPVENIPLMPEEERGSVTRALTLLSSLRFVHRPATKLDEVKQRIAAIRDEWDENK